MRQITQQSVNAFMNAKKFKKQNMQVEVLPNVTLLPHIGSATIETREKMGMLALSNLLAFFNKSDIPNRVV